MAKPEKIAARLGVTLNNKYGGLGVNGHHGIGKWSAGGPANGCGSYDLRLDVEAEEVVCNDCGARPLTRTNKVQSGGSGQ